MIFKIAFGKQIHLINSQDKPNLHQLLSAIPSTFKGLPSRFTLTYFDEDGDEITLKEQEDYEVLLTSGVKTAKINIRQNLEEFIEMTNEIVIQETEPVKEEERPIEKIEEPKEPEVLEVSQEVDESLIEQKLKKMIPDIISKIKSEITEELSERSRLSSRNQPIIIEEPIFHKTNEKKSEDQKPKDGKVIHSGVTCDSCQWKNIEGVRYKCSVCSNFDFCEKCEASVEHPHPFLKIKTLKQTPVKIFTVINDEEEGGPSLQANGHHIPIPPAFEQLAHHGIDLVRGFFGGASREEMRNKCHAAKAEWIKRAQECRRNWHCQQNCEEKSEKKTEEATEVKPEVKVEEKVEPKVEAKEEIKKDEPKGLVYDAIKRNADYLVEVFGYSFEKCLKWAQMHPYMTREELLNFCITQSAFLN